jgi:hypothetical protein
MDVWGVPGLEAEAELISSVVSCFRDLGLTSSDVGIKVGSGGDVALSVRRLCSANGPLWLHIKPQVNSRTLLNEVMTLSGTPLTSRMLRPQSAQDDKLFLQRFLAQAFHRPCTPRCAWLWTSWTSCPQQPWSSNC